MPLLKKKWNKKKIDHFFFLVKFDMVFVEQIAISYQFVLSQGAVTPQK